MKPSDLSNPDICDATSDEERVETSTPLHPVKHYEQPWVTVDAVMMSIRQRELQVLLIKRKAWPFAGTWALPGGFVAQEEALEDAAQRVLAAEAGLQQVYLEQLATFGAPERDPRARVITVVYVALLSGSAIRFVQAQAANEAVDLAWFSVLQLPPLAFDHQHILDYALQRLRGKLDYTPIAFHLLPEQFTLGEVQQVYERIRCRPLDKRNFRKKILATGIVKETGGYRREGARHRPARLYRFQASTTQGRTSL